MDRNKVSAFSPMLFFLALFAVAAVKQTSQPSIIGRSDSTAVSPKTGKELYLDACASCHGAQGRGIPQSQLGFETPVPDFTDCNFATREPDADWIAITHQGGPVRAFSKEMPAFGDAMTTTDIQKVLDYVRTFCTDEGWPKGNLNLPRPLLTEKAFPEDEAVISTFVDLEGQRSVMSEIVYEQRFGARNQFEIVVPFGFMESPAGSWNGGQLGDVAFGVKRAFYHNNNSGTIFSAAGEIILPTGDRETGFGKGTTILEPFVSFGQILPNDSFFQFQGGMEFPLINRASKEAFWRGALGTSFTQGTWGRTWSPILELAGGRELESGAETQWDIIPQLQVTLNKRQNIMLNVGARIPVDNSSRDTQLGVYILWDWFDGGLLEGW